MLELPDPVDDGLVIPEVGEWSRDKHHFLRRDVDAFTTAMKDKPWEGLHYIDLFAGAGMERLRDTGRLDWGSPLIAAQSTHPFNGIHCGEMDAAKCDALCKRLTPFRARTAIQIVAGDANVRVQEIVAVLPKRCLSLAFLDPYGLHLHFDSLRTLAERRADLIIFFPDRLDLLRNATEYYFSDPDSNLDHALGTQDWRRVWDGTPESRRAQTMRSLYVDRLRVLGYREFDYEPVPATGRRLYWLVFASRHPRGVDIWRRVATRKPDGQRTFDFE